MYGYDYEAKQQRQLAVDSEGRMHTNSSGVVLPSAARTASGVSADQVNSVGRGVQLVVDVTAISGTSPTFTVTVEGKDPASDKYYTLLTSAALSAVGTTVLTVYPGVTAAANVAASQALPRTWRVSYAIAGTTPSVTASVGANRVV